ncbi:hypothetical protein [Taibaiella chishuiensis]|uniref:Uncharacterized protein n=1 Tax=Taibaiella chishuiensis TaxID=1434707 RepID=A0A2P8DBH1_9BACT|nr:hypothetical protein [Taibaiella chishuiensis]PSK94571.1 hypothetical protein B0I18_101727 [Taibaiella chishuiensis]
MERIENVLRRIQEVYYSRHEKTGIDIDLMLDYTRVMYADLLEWRKRFKEEPPVTTSAATAAPEADTTEAPAQPTPAQAPVAADEPAAQPEQTQPEPGITSADPETGTVPAQPEPQLAADPVERAESAAVPDVEAIPAETIAGLEKEEVEAEMVKEVLHNNASAISFEPPAPRPAHTMEIEDVLAEDDPVVNTPVEDIVLPEVETAPLPAPVQVPQEPSLRKDIRGAIGINDKYLFLNELFANNKTDYEETLDQLRLFDNYEEAYNWLQTYPAQKNRWDKEDDTVQSFLSLVKQYLSSR